MTPRLRTVTSGLRSGYKLCVSQSENSRKLNRRTLYGQLFEQYLVPTQRLYTMSLRPSVLCTVAATGHTGSQGAFSHCMQGIGWKKARGLDASALKLAPLSKYVSTRIQCISRPASTCSLPTTAMLFSATQATTQALQPMQEFISIAMPHWCMPTLLGSSVQLG